MTMETKQKIDVTVQPDEFKRFEEKAFESIRRELALPGFRKGTVTPDVARKHIDPKAVFSEAVERAVSDKGTEAIKHLMNRIVGQPDVQVTKVQPGEPLEFLVTVELLPEVDISDWRQLRISFEPKKVSEEDIQKVLDDVVKSRAKTQAVSRPAQKGDLVEVDFETRVKGVKAEGGESKNHPLVLGEGKFVPGFEDAVVGMERGQSKQLTLPFPKDWPVKQLAGEEGVFSITLNNVLERILPELDDTFAQGLGDFANLIALRKNIREGLEIEREAEEHQRVRQEAVEQLGKRIKEKAIPEVVVAQELSRMRDEFKSRIEMHGGTLEQYLAELGKQEGELEKDWREAALDRARATLVVRAIAEAEDVVPDATTIDERANELLQRQRNQMGAAGETLDPDRVRSYTETILLNEMTLELIEQVVTKTGNN